MKKMKKICALAISGVMLASIALPLAGCSGSSDSDLSASDGPSGTIPEEEPFYVPTTFEFDEQVKGDDWTLVNDTFGKYSVSYYTVNNVVYCTKPTHPESECMRFYVPAAYLNADGTINTENEVNGYTAETAPVIYINNCSGYIGDPPWELTSIFRLAGVNSKYYGWYYNYLENGFVLVFVGERGKQSYDENGNVVGVAPTSLVDLKAGVRFLKHNADKIPGDMNKIVSNGVSAGGNMSALLGVTGNSDLYDEYLAEIGAYMEADADDSVFATQAYCPITDLDHAALAYEWMWQDDDATGSLEGFYGAISKKLAAKYAEYVNAMNLKDESGAPLTLSADGTRSGTFYDWLKAQYERSYEHYVSINGDTDSATYSWLSYDDENGASVSSLAEMIESGYNPRQKACISFDQVDGYGDNAVFGLPGAKKNSDDTRRHFTPDLPELLEELKSEYPEEYQKYYRDYYDDTTNPEILDMIYLYNPYHFITDGTTDISEYFRINVGTQDRDTSPTVSAVYALLLQNAGYDVEYNLVWNQIHIDADMEGEFEAWVNDICK